MHVRHCNIGIELRDHALSCVADRHAALKLAGLDAKLVQEFKREYAQLYKRMNVDRNQAWLPKLRAILNVNYLMFDDTDAIEVLLHDDNAIRTEMAKVDKARARVASVEESACVAVPAFGSGLRGCTTMAPYMPLAMCWATSQMMEMGSGTSNPSLVMRTAVSTGPRQDQPPPLSALSWLLT